MKRHNTFLLVAALAAIALAAAGCAKTASNTNASNTNTSTNTSTTSNSTTSTANTSTTTPTAAGSPSAVFRAVYDAVKNKDVAGFKRHLASADLKALEESVAKGGETVDDFLKEMLDNQNNLPPTLETRNEQITGDRATLESKKKQGGWETIHFIKEGGEWKVMVDGAKEAGQEAGKEMKQSEHGGGGH